jgi:predicted kinase
MNTEEIPVDADESAKAPHTVADRRSPAGNAPATAPAVSIPELSLVVLIGVSGSGKSTFARTHFRPTQVLSSDFCRGLVADDENDQTATPAAFDVLHYIAATRLRAGRLTVIDATNVKREDRAKLVQLARDHDVLPVAIVLDVPESLAVERNTARADRDMNAGVIRRQRADLRRGLRGLSREGFRRSTSWTASPASTRRRSGTRSSTTTGARITARSTSSATSTAAAPSSSSCSPSSAMC